MILPLHFRTILYFSIFFLSSNIVLGSNCSHSCGNKFLPFPFGFSSGCPIQLNCTSIGHIVINKFPVQSVTSDTILINLLAKCTRPFSAIHNLFSSNYAPTSRNGILFQNCSFSQSSCLIPSTMIQTHFELLDCGKENMSCYSEPNSENNFIDLRNLSRTVCGSLFSAISVESNLNSSAVSLDVQVVQLGWWVHGRCQCTSNANCTKITSPTDGKLGYRCQCFEGFIGDGFLAGSGCRKALAKLFEELVGQDQRFDIVTPRKFSLVCFGLLPPQSNEDDANKLNHDLLDAVNSTGKLFISHTLLSDGYLLRFAVGAPLTEERHTIAAWKVLQDEAAT